MTVSTTPVSTDNYIGINSYIVKMEGNISIPIKRTFDIWTAYAGTDATTGKVLDFSDVNNLTGTLSAEIITSTALNGIGIMPVLTVNTGLDGNALIRVLIGDKCSGKCIESRC